MELGRIFVHTNLRNWLKSSQQTRTKLLSAVLGVTLTGISIVSLWNEVFPTLCLCLTTGCHLGFTEKSRNLWSWRLFTNSSNAATAFSLSLQFHVCGCDWYKLYSRKRCILVEGKRLGGETVGLQYPVWLLHNFHSNVKEHVQWQISVCMSLLTAIRLSIIRSFPLHQTRYGHSIHYVRNND